MRYKRGDEFVDSNTGYLYRVVNSSEYREPQLAYLVDVYDGEKYLTEGFMSDKGLDVLKKVNRL